MSRKEQDSKTYMGTEIYENKRTGELIEACTWYNPVKDTDFDKIFIMEAIANEYADIAGKKMSVLMYVLNHRDKGKNIFIGTCKQIADDMGISEKTVQQALKRIQTGNLPILKKMQTGVYMVNPAIISRHNHGQRMGLMNIYEQINQEEREDEQLEGQVEFNTETEVS